LIRFRLIDTSNGCTGDGWYIDDVEITETGINSFYCDDDGDGHFNKWKDGLCIGTNCQPAGCQLTPGNDNCADYYNLNQTDSDSDGLGDACDNCTETPNTCQADTDGDGYGNMCDADLDNDGVVGFNDYNLFGFAWGADPSTSNWNPDADFDSDGVIGFNDYNLFGTRWGTSVPFK